MLGCLNTPTISCKWYLGLRVLLDGKSSVKKDKTMAILDLQILVGLGFVLYDQRQR